MLSSILIRVLRAELHGDLFAILRNGLSNTSWSKSGFLKIISLSCCLHGSLIVSLACRKWPSALDFLDLTISIHHFKNVLKSCPGLSV